VIRIRTPRKVNNYNTPVLKYTKSVEILFTL
jgi:hypothetical protein